MTEKELFFQKINEAFAKSDTRFFKDNITQDIKWTAVGFPPIEGKDAFIKAMQGMEIPQGMELFLNHIIIQGDAASVDGVIKIKDQWGKENRFAFCDIYVLDGRKESKVKEITSYVIEIP